MSKFYANRNSILIKGLIYILCIALALSLSVMLSKYIISSKPESFTQAEVGECSSCPTYIEKEPEATVAESNQTETFESNIPNTETIESATIAPAPTKPVETIPTDTEVTIPAEPETIHQHSYSSTVTKAATCTSKGTKTYTCACGDSYTKDTSALGHKYEKTVVQPTQSTQGYTQHTCIRCNDSYKTNYTNPLVDPNHVHSYVANVVAPNCFRVGYTTYTCSCGRTYKDLNSITQPLGHTWGEWNDCSDGSSTKDCLICGRKWFKVNEDCSTGYYSNDAEYYEGLLVVGGASGRIDSTGDPNGNPADYVAPADTTTGISWDGVSPIVYTYADGSTGTEPKLGATFYVTPNRIGIISALNLNWVSNEEYFGGSTSDGYCGHCGRQYGDGTNGTCIRWLAGGTHICEHCGNAVPDHTCHSCPEE